MACKSAPLLIGAHLPVLWACRAGLFPVWQSTASPHNVCRGCCVGHAIRGQITNGECVASHCCHSWSIQTADMWGWPWPVPWTREELQQRIPPEVTSEEVYLISHCSSRSCRPCLWSCAGCQTWSRHLGAVLAPEEAATEGSACGEQGCDLPLCPHALFCAHSCFHLLAV